MGAPYIPHPASQPTTDPWAPCEADFRRAVEADAARQERYGVKKEHPSLGRLAVAQMWAIIAGESAGTRKRFGGAGPQWANLANALTAGVKMNQEAAARLLEARSGDGSE